MPVLSIYDRRSLLQIVLTLSLLTENKDLWYKTASSYKA